MKYFILVFFLTLFLSCTDDTPEPVKKELPPITTTGENTFGCLVNGEVWIPDSDMNSILRPELVAKYDELADFLIIEAEFIKTDQDISQTLSILCIAEGEGIFNLMNTSSPRFFDRGTPCPEYFYDENTMDQIEILNLDTENNIVSGKFYYSVIDTICPDTLQISEGRFDLKYTL